jgi:hypothetical protein
VEQRAIPITSNSYSNSLSFDIVTEIQQVTSVRSTKTAACCPAVSLWHYKFVQAFTSARCQAWWLT